MRSRRQPNRNLTSGIGKAQIRLKADRAILTDADYKFLLKYDLKEIAIKEYLRNGTRSY